MRKIHIHGQDVILTCARRVQETAFNRACELVSQSSREVVSLKKSSIILLHDHMQNYFLMERMNTDTLTLQVQYDIPSQKVIKINS